jgi:hypothetical protein
MNHRKGFLLPISIQINKISICNKQNLFRALRSYYSKSVKFVTLLLLVLFITVLIPAKTYCQDSIAKKKNIDEWQEIFKLRSKFANGKFGSQYVMGLFDGKFVGPNGRTDNGNRTYTTAYDYLILGDNFLSLLINLGYTAEGVSFISTEQVPSSHPYYLGCIMYYSIVGEKHWVDSVYSTRLGKKVPEENPYYATRHRLKIDSAQVKVELAGIVSKKKSGKKWVTDTLIIPQIEGTGSWKDANNYDMAYEWMDYLFKLNMDSYEINKRQFSKHTPDDLKEIILQRFDTKKYLQQVNKEERFLKWKIKNKEGFEVYDMIHQENGAVMKAGDYEFFRFFGDVYWKEKTKVTSEKNLIWHSAFQYDKDAERGSGGLIDFVVLYYGTRNYIMPTVVPRDLPGFTQFEGVVIYHEGTERATFSNKDDIWINTINGRLVDRNLNEYPSERGILPLNDDGTVDRIYKIYSWKDAKLYWAYIYCGKHAGVRGGKPGKSFVDQVDNFREQYSNGDYWFFNKDVDYTKEVKNKMPSFIQSVKNFVNKIAGIEGKTIPCVRLVLKYPDEKDPKKIKREYKKLTFNEDYTALLEPDGLIIPWEIEETRDSVYNSITQIRLNILGEYVYLQDLEDYLLAHKIPILEVQKFNRKFKKEREKKRSGDNFLVVEGTVETYDMQEYNLLKTEDVKNLLEKVTQDITALDYQMTQTSESIEWQKTKKVNPLELRMEELESSGQTETDEYKRTKALYDVQAANLEQMEQNLLRLENRIQDLRKYEQMCRESYIKDLEKDLIKALDKKSFVNQQIDNLQTELHKMEQEGTETTDIYNQVKQTLLNKDAELKEAQDAENEVRKLIAEQKILVQ